MPDGSSAGGVSNPSSGDADRRIHLLLDGLDDEQRHAVTTPSRTLVIRAAAGAGKTRVLTRRLAYRDAVDDLDPRRALCVTFTREAAAELRSRLRKLGLRDLPAAGTFHGIASALLRIRWHDQRSSPPGLVADRADLVARADRRLAREPARLARVVAEIDWARARGIPAVEYPLAARRAQRRPGVEPEAVVHAFEAYEVAKKAARVIDFDDLLERCAEAFERDETFAAAQRWRFQHLFVDEFQDVNPLQFRLLRAWLGDRRDLCVVGDPNQAIYGWNGADPSLFDRVGELLDDRQLGLRPGGGVEIVELRTNHRSTPQVVQVSSAALDDGREPGRPGVVGGGHGGGPVPTVVACEDEHDEAVTVAATLRRWHDRGVPWAEQAVLVRTNALARALRQSLTAAGVPVVQTGRGGPHRWAEALPPATTWADLLDALDELSGGAAAELAILATEYADLDPRPTPTGFASWLSTVRARASVGPDGPGTAGPSDAVVVSTFHAAKGREWQAVAVAGLEAGIVPLAGTGQPGSAAESEERRLCYVALSRATELLALTWATTRTVRGVVTPRERSPYLGRVVDTCRGLAVAERPASPPAELRRRLASVAPPEESAPRASRRRSGGGGAGAGDTVGGAVSGSSTVDDLAAARRTKLETWRARRARGAGVAPAVVLSDRALTDLARRPPVDLDDLAARPDVGPIVADRYGRELFDVLRGGQPPSNSAITTV